MSESMKLEGTVETCLEKETFPSGFCKRVLVLNTGGEYPQMIPVEFVKDKTELLNGLRKGQQVTAYINIRGNEHNGKYYANIQGWKLDKGDAGDDFQLGQQAKPQAPAQAPAQYEEDDSSDIPF